MEISLNDVLRDLETRVISTIKERLAIELRPVVDGIVNRIVEEETAKMAVELSTMMTFERMGATLQIVIKKVATKNG